jgi:hypothetical protein
MITDPERPIRAHRRASGKTKGPSSRGPGLLGSLADGSSRRHTKGDFNAQHKR